MNRDPINGNPNLTDLSFFFLCIMFFYLSPKFLFCALFLFTFLPLPIVPYHSLSDQYYRYRNPDKKIQTRKQMYHRLRTASYALRQSAPLRGFNRHTNGLAISTRRGFHATGAKPMALLDTIAPWTLVPLHDALQAVHMGTGLPWYALIPLATVAMRTVVTLPVAIANRVRTRKQVALAPVLSAAGPVLRARLAASEAAREGRLTTEQVTVLAQKEARRRRVELFRRHGCQVWKSVVLLPLVQMPVWVGTSLVVRAMCGWSAGGVTAIGVEPGFSVPTEAAFAWYPDLVTADPYGLLPLIIGAVSLANVEWNTNNLLNRSGSASRRSLQSQGGPVQRVVANLSRVGVLFFMTAAFQAPAALGLYWASSASFSFLQNVAFDRFLPLHRVDPRSVMATTGSALPKPNRIETRVIRA